VAAFVFPAFLQVPEIHRIHEHIEFMTRVPRDWRVEHMRMNSIRLIRFREEDEMESDGHRVHDSRLVIVVPGEPQGPNVSGTFVIPF
jgi:hypothetical protein